MPRKARGANVYHPTANPSNQAGGAPGDGGSTASTNSLIEPTATDSPTDSLSLAGSQPDADVVEVSDDDDEVGHPRFMIFDYSYLSTGRWLRRSQNACDVNLPDLLHLQSACAAIQVLLPFPKWPVQ